MKETLREGGIMQRLRAETRGAHEAAEHSAFQQKLVRGDLTLDLYRTHLEQLLLLHREMDAALQDLRASLPQTLPLLADWQWQTPYLEEDLDALGGTQQQEASLPTTHRAALRVRALAQNGDIAILGMHYVLEGSKNGSKFIARAIRKRFSWEGSFGTKYLDPYGDGQSAKWQEFKTEFDRLSLTSEESDRIVAAAHEMFDIIASMGDEVLDQAAQA